MIQHIPENVDVEEVAVPKKIKLPMVAVRQVIVPPSLRSFPPCENFVALSIHNIRYRYVHIGIYLGMENFVHLHDRNTNIILHIQSESSIINSCCSSEC